MVSANFYVDGVRYEAYGEYDADRKEWLDIQVDCCPPGWEEEAFIDRNESRIIDALNHCRVVPCNWEM